MFQTHAKNICVNFRVGRIKVSTIIFQFLLTNIFFLRDRQFCILFNLATFALSLSLCRLCTEQKAKQKRSIIVCRTKHGWPTSSSTNLGALTAVAVLPNQQIFKLLCKNDYFLFETESRSSFVLFYVMCEK